MPTWYKERKRARAELRASEAKEPGGALYENSQVGDNGQSHTRIQLGYDWNECDTVDIHATPRLCKRCLDCRDGYKKPRRSPKYNGPPDGKICGQFGSHVIRDFPVSYGLMLYRSGADIYYRLAFGATEHKRQLPKDLLGDTSCLYGGHACMALLPPPAAGDSPDMPCLVCQYTRTDIKFFLLLFSLDEGMFRVLGSRRYNHVMQRLYRDGSPCSNSVREHVNPELPDWCQDWRDCEHANPLETMCSRCREVENLVLCHLRQKSKETDDEMYLRQGSMYLQTGNRVKFYGIYIILSLSI
jgi:hypothetical protein